MKNLFRKKASETTETLWNNEVQANVFVARIMCVASVVALLFMVLNWVGVFTNDNVVLTTTMLLTFVILFIPSMICLRLKGERRWLKFVLLPLFCLSFFGAEMIYGDHATLCMVIPVVLSVRYYSRETTSVSAVITVVLAFLAEFLGVVTGLGRLDLNRVYLPAGTAIVSSEYTKLRDLIPLEIIDSERLLMDVLRHNMLPKLILLTLISLICIEIARRGRKTILEQQAETQRTERLETEINLASQIQNDVLPNSFPAFPDRTEFSLYASMSAARKVGGDFYDFFFVDQDHLALVIADVSGKGVGAALFMMLARTLIKTRTLMGGSPSEILADVNDQLCEGNKEMLFVTVWLGILDVTTGKAVTSNAGHEHPALRRSGSRYELVTYRHSFVLGGMEGTKYAEREFQLHPGDSLFVYTDGVPEAQNSSDTQFGTGRMLDALNKQTDSPPEETIANVQDGMNLFIAGAEQFDDITMLCLQYYGNPDTLRNRE